MMPWSKNSVKVAQLAWDGVLVFMVIPVLIRCLNSVGVCQ